MTCGECRRNRELGFVPIHLAVELPYVAIDVELVSVIAEAGLVVDMRWNNADWSDEEQAVDLLSNFWRRVSSFQGFNVAQWTYQSRVPRGNNTLEFDSQSKELVYQCPWRYICPHHSS